MKNILKSFLNSIGFEIRRRRASEDSNTNIPTTDTMDDGLRRCQQNGILAQTIVDIGAAGGSWTSLAMQYWPVADYLLFEPLVERKIDLERFLLDKNNCRLVSAAAGRQEGEIDFYIADDLDGSGVATDFSVAEDIRKVSVTTVNAEIVKNALLGPYIIKLDTHGFEVPIIEGCSSVLQNTSLIIIECYGFNITKDSLLFWEMCTFMKGYNFRLIDIVDIMRRPKDQAFWQCDAFFVPANSPLFKNNSYNSLNA